MNKKDYQWYKSKGICTKCLKEKAVDGKTMCWECLDKNKALSEKTRSDNSKNQRREFLKAKRKKCIEQGICRECLKKKATVGKYCLECYVKMTKRNNKNKKNRNVYTELGLCYFCGEPAEKGFHTCNKHHEIMANNLHRNKLNNENHIWRAFQGGEVHKIQYWRSQNNISM